MPTGYLYKLLTQLGMSDFSARTAEFIVVRPAKILFLVILATIASRIASRVVRGLIASVGSRSALRGNSDRAPRRADAIGSTASSIARVAVWAIAVPLILDQLGVNLGPFIAGATIIGAALGFGAQSLVKDLLGGFMILSQDQYGVGDTIVVGANSGTVEDVTLLRTRFRADDGKVWFVANGDIRAVANASLGWSRATVDVDLPYGADLDTAVRAARREAVKFAEEPEWADAVLGPPVAYGQEVRFDHLTLRVTARSAPGKGPAVSRALLARVNRAVRKPDSELPGHEEPEPEPQPDEAGVAGDAESQPAP